MIETEIITEITDCFLCKEDLEHEVHKSYYIDEDLGKQFLSATYICSKCGKINH